MADDPYIEEDYGGRAVPQLSSRPVRKDWQDWRAFAMVLSHLCMCVFGVGLMFDGTWLFISMMLVTWVLCGIGGYDLVRRGGDWLFRITGVLALLWIVYTSPKVLMAILFVLFGHF